MYEATLRLCKLLYNFRSLCALCKLGTALAGTAVTFLTAKFGVPAAVGALGFGAGGVATGSWAAWMMSWYGGAVPAGGVVATLQAVGAGGLGYVGETVIGTLRELLRQLRRGYLHGFVQVVEQPAFEIQPGGLNHQA